MTNANKLFKILLASAAFSLSAPVMADVKAGVDAWGRGDFQTAINEWRGPAAAGDADAQFNLAQAYKLGRGVPMDLGQAESWYRKAADQGHLQASDNYGLLLFQNGQRTTALPYLQASAGRGEPRAQYVLGTGYFNGDFVQKDWVKAYALMTRSSAQGLPQATTNLAQMDKFIPIEDRRRAVELAGKMEQEEQRNRTAQLGGLRPASPSGPVQTAQLPPSQIPTTPTVPVAVNTNVATPPPAIATATRPGVTYDQSPAPSPPPRATSVSPQATSVTTQPTVTATRVSDGNWRVQLGAFGDEGKAKDLWNNLEGRISQLQGLQPYLVKAGGITRLQAGPLDSKAQADALCAKVKASGNGCITKAR